MGSAFHLHLAKRKPTWAATDKEGSPGLNESNGVEIMFCKELRS